MPNLLRHHYILEYLYPWSRYSPLPVIYLHPEKNSAEEFHNDNTIEYWSTNLLAISMSHVSHALQLCVVHCKIIVFYFSNGEIV